MTNDNGNAEEPKKAGKPRRSRGTGFPVVPLADAARYVTDAGKHGTTHTLDAFAEYMGHGTTNSGAFRQRFAALRDWNLVTGSGDSIALTDLGQKIAFEADPDERQKALREAFRSCEVFARLLDESAKGVRIDPSKIASRGVLSHGVAPQSRGTFMRSFVQSAIAAGFADEAGDEIVLRDPDLESDDEGDRDVRVEDRASGAEKAEVSRPRAAVPAVVRQAWPTAAGEVIFEIRSRTPIPAKAYADVAKAVEQLEQLVDALGRPTVATEGDDDGSSV